MKRCLLGTIIFLLGVSLVLGCAPAPEVEKPPILIGMSIDLTGANAPLGKAQRDA